jgi:peptidoglycan biosynthesis protein MviN/MurJ (putative lipid II flippase)
MVGFKFLSLSLLGATTNFVNLQNVLTKGYYAKRNNRKTMPDRLIALQVNSEFAVFGSRNC